MAASPSAGLDQRMLQRIRRLGLPAGAAIGVAFSGGNDSLALAIAMARCAKRASIRPVLMHIDHQLRPESQTDLERCIEIADQLELPIRTSTLSTGMAQRSGGAGLEHQARIERYTALAKLCEEEGAPVLATAHHENDQAETVLMHLFRGSGLAGLSGMRNLSRAPVDLPFHESPLLVWRPLLEESRATLEDYVAASGLEPVVDASNAEIAFRRNAVRHEILPVVDRHFPGAVQAIGRFAWLVQEDADYLDAQAENFRATIQQASGALDIVGLTDLPLSLSSRVVRDWLIGAGVEEPTAERVREIVRFAGEQEGSEEAHLEAGSGLWIVRDGRDLLAGEPVKLVSRFVEDAGFLLLVDDDPVVVNDDGLRRSFHTTGWLIDVSEYAGRKSSPGDATTLVAVPPAVGLADIEVRRIQPGDRLHAYGEPVRELFRTSGVHPLARCHIACLAAGSLVLAIPGYFGKMSGRNDGEPSDSRTIHIRWKKEKRGA